MKNILRGRNAIKKHVAAVAIEKTLTPISVKHFLSFSIILLLLISCNDKKEIFATGFYLVMENPDSTTITLKFNSADTSEIYVRRNPILEEKHFEKFDFTKNSNDTFLVFLNTHGRERIKMFDKKYSGRKIALVMNGQLIGLTGISNPVQGDYGFGFRYSISDDSLMTWSKKLNREFSKRDEDGPPGGIYREYYEDGKLMLEEKYKGSSLINSVSYYESGNVKEKSNFIMNDSTGTLAVDTKSYYENGKLSMDAHSDNGEDWLRNWFMNGQIHNIDSSFHTFDGMTPQFHREYDSVGNFIYMFAVDYKERFPGQNKWEEPSVKTESYYANGKISAEGTLYDSGWGMGGFENDSCDFLEDSVGVWKFYEDGKLIRTKKFPSWEELYKKDLRDAQKAFKEEESDYSLK
jgi:antitoxin component YwqK of YwqJK toxin-antitoxin module